MSDLVDRAERPPEYRAEEDPEIVPIDRWTCTGCRRTFSADDPCFVPGVCVDCVHRGRVR